MARDIFKEYFERIAKRDSTNDAAAVALQNVVLPIAIALLGIITTQLWSMNKILTVAMWVFLLLIYFLVWWKSYPLHKDIYGLLIQKQKDDDKISSLKEENELFERIVDDLYFKNIASFALRAMSIEYIKAIRDKGIDKNYLCEMLDEILSPFYMAGDSIFDFEISEKWSIGIYLYDEKASVLRSVWRKTSGTHPSKGRIGRDWMPGEGHVGKAFLDRRPILTGNANDDAVAQLCRARASKWREQDNETYVSFASVPIAIASDDGIDPYGILVVTSDVEGRL
ncbi:GAF domain-containing protein, partial [Aquamicrobium sp.]|uniref:GAF domain-containing protein n=1 Tax=Aquamicrobium sp. TaxID=1872579 RepID=UPI0025859565